MVSRRERGDRCARWWRLGLNGCLAAMLVLLPTIADAQDARGTIAGTVRDSSGGMVPGATVTIANVDMGTVVSAVTNANGLFEVPYLIPGAYAIVVELPGFKKYSRQGLQLRVADRLHLEVDLEIGAAAEVVT